MDSGSGPRPPDGAKVTCWLRTQPGLDEKALSEYWSAAHCDALRAKLNDFESVTRWERIGDAGAVLGAPPGFDALEDIRLAGRLSAIASLTQVGDCFDHQFVDIERCLFVAAVEHTVIDSGAGGSDGWVRSVGMWKPPFGTPPRAAFEHWRTQHARLVQGTPGVVSYVQAEIVASTVSEERPWTGMAELVWTGLDAMQEFATSGHRDEQVADARNFCDPASVVSYLGLGDGRVLRGARPPAGA